MNISTMNRKSHWIILTFVFLIVFILHFASPIITSFDSRWSIHTAMSIIKEGNTDLDEYKKQIEANGLYAIRIEDGHYYNMYPIGVSIIAVPFVYILDKCSSLILPIAPRIEAYIKKMVPILGWARPDAVNVIALFGLVEKFIASIIVAITALFIYLIARLYLDRKYSLLITFIFAFCTSAWSTASRALWQHGLSMLMLSIALYLILLAKDKPRLILYGESHSGI